MLSCTKRLQLPYPPNISVYAAVDPAAVILVWDPVPKVSGYYVYRSFKMKNGYKQIIDMIHAPCFVDTNIHSHMMYYYKIAAVKGKHRSSLSKAVYIMPGNYIASSYDYHNQSTSVLFLTNTKTEVKYIELQRTNYFTYTNYAFTDTDEMITNIYIVTNYIFKTNRIVLARTNYVAQTNVFVQTNIVTIEDTTPVVVQKSMPKYDDLPADTKLLCITNNYTEKVYLDPMTNYNVLYRKKYITNYQYGEKHQKTIHISTNIKESFKGGHRITNRVYDYGITLKTNKDTLVQIMNKNTFDYIFNLYQYRRSYIITERVIIFTNDGYDHKPIGQNWYDTLNYSFGYKLPSHTDLSKTGETFNNINIVLLSGTGIVFPDLENASLTAPNLIAPQFHSMHGTRISGPAVITKAVFLSPNNLANLQIGTGKVVKLSADFTKIPMSVFTKIKFKRVDLTGSTLTVSQLEYITHNNHTGRADSMGIWGIAQVNDQWIEFDAKNASIEYYDYLETPYRDYVH